MKKAIFVDLNSIECPDSALERTLIAEYLLTQGYRLLDLSDLPEQEVSNLMKNACRYATQKLAEIEARSKLRRKIEATQ